MNVSANTGAVASVIASASHPRRVVIGISSAPCSGFRFAAAELVEPRVEPLGPEIERALHVVPRRENALDALLADAAIDSGSEPPVRHRVEDLPLDAGLADESSRPGRDA